MTSRKRSSKKKTSPQSSSGNPCTNEEIVPKGEFEVEQEEKEAYWDALCGSITPPPEVFYPTRPATHLDLTLPSMTSPAYLKTLREFYSVPSGVVFRVPVHGESVEDPTEGFFTCYEAFRTRCRMWFPISEAIVRALDRFELSISQLSVAALQNFLGMLILSYELGMDLSPDEFEGLWSTRKTSIDYSHRMFRACFLCSNRWRIRQGELSPLVPCRMELSSCVLPTIPMDLFDKRDLLRNGPFFWDSFTLDRILNAVALYRSQGISRPLRASDMDEPHPNAVPDQRERVRPRKDKGIALEERNFVSEDLPLPGWNPGFTPGDGSGTSEAPLPDDFFANLPRGFTTPASLDEASRREVVAEVGSTTVSGVGLSAGKAMDSGTMSLSGVVAWSGLFISFGRAIGIQEEVFYACDLQNFAGEELRSKPCAENLAVHSGMTSGMVELAVGIILELVPGPGISGSLSLFGVDSVIMLALEIFSLVVDIPVVTRVFPSRGRLLRVVLLGEDFHLFFHHDEEEVFYACDLRNFAGEELRSKPCTENLAVHSGMTSGLVELAVGIILELVPGPVGSTTVSGVGLSAGKAMDSGTMSLSGVVAWSGDSGSLFMELLGVFGRAIGIHEEVFYACDLRNFAGEELRSKPCAENLAVHSGMTYGLVELAIGIILELVGSGVGLSAGKAMDSGTMSLSGVVACFGRPIGIQEEVFYACDLQNFAGEELWSKPCAENLAVHSGMTSGLVELAVGIILELVPGPVRRDMGIASKGPRIVLR
ncbi:hypothetical protein F2Q68_00016467 [Brassica cretica]|uniref:Uncharacterized protein n=1 Tax=Brassica cretica TaxID=69181 RepID=A0A8S9HLU9_BRACR|nr:hypothetical protein F2Q68_00016467 [Brassica cretica]